MAKNTLEDLRNHLFETLEALRDEEKPMDVERAKAVCNVAARLIDSAKTEIKFLELTGRDNTVGRFFDEKKTLPAMGRPVV